MKAFRSVFLAHYKQFVRDRGALFFTFIFPIMFVLIFGWVFNQGGVQTFDIGFVDEGSPVSVGYISEAMDKIIIDNDKVFDIKTGDLDRELKALRDGKLDAVIVVPAGGYGQLPEHQKQPVDLKVYDDPSQASNQQVLIPY